MYLMFGVGLTENGLLISIVRNNFAEMKTTVMRDFFRILDMYDLYDRSKHNKTDHTYVFNGNTYEFIGMDIAAKKKGARRDILYINEGMEVDLDSWFQLSARTRGDIFIDYNPTQTEHWIYEHVIPREDCEFIHSTYLDNYDFLTANEIREIEYWRGKDDYYWKVYGEGLRGDVKGLVFPMVEIVPSVPKSARRIAYGLDFGFTNSYTALYEVFLNQGAIWMHQKIYSRGLTNPDIHSEALRAGVDITFGTVADSAEPKSIRELQNMGWSVEPAHKGPDSIKNGIDILKRYPLRVTKPSNGMIKEKGLYKWEDNKLTGKIGEGAKPIDANNDTWDAVRYVVLNRIGNPVAQTISVEVI